MPSKARAVCVDPKRVHCVWYEVSHWIKIAMERGDLGTFDDVERDVLSGAALLWIVWNDPKIDGAAVTQLTQSEKSKVCTIVACGGHGFRHWVHLIEQLEDYARAEGCDCTRIYGRPGWLRVLQGYAAKKVILEKAL